MKNYIKQCINSDFEHKYLLPFLHIHGEPQEKLAEQLDAIYNYGIREVCVESRPHPEFCRDGWWRDLGFILERAETLGMKVWVLDDYHFPTGHANYYIKEHPELKRRLVKLRYRDILVKGGGYVAIPKDKEDDELLGIVAYKRGEDLNKIYGQGIDLTRNIEGNILKLDLEDGLWRICYLVKTYFAHEYISEHYIDMLRPDSCEAMIKAVYEPHYEHFGKYFGNVLKGFFSDEPCFNNALFYHSLPGNKVDEPMPWNDNLIPKLALKMGITEGEVIANLPSLWLQGDNSKKLRTEYMQLVSDEYSENFNRLLGEWCREHNVLYIGHILEDMGTHCRLGWGAGHYFKALKYQDMSGIDIVLHQMIPGVNDLTFTAPLECEHGVSSPAFFNCTLPKLASSLAHISPRMQNRSMCEIFGGFGWASGVPRMRHLADSMLCCGINYFVPHAFNEKSGDNSCPPYFKTEGIFAQTAAFGTLSEYMQRTSFLYEDTKNMAHIAVAYVPEGEWSGDSFMCLDTVTKTLCERQIDFDIVPWQLLTNAKDNKVSVSGTEYKIVIVPECASLPKETLQQLSALAKDMPIVVLGKLPTCIECGKVYEDENFIVLPIEKLCDYLVNNRYAKVLLNSACEHLRVHHTEKHGEKLYFLYNQSGDEVIDNILKTDCGNYALYDIWANRIYKPQVTENGIRIRLEPFMTVAVVSDDNPAQYPDYPYCDSAPDMLECGFEITLCPCGDSDFRKPLESDNLSTFGGQICYETKFIAKNPYTVLDLGDVGETSEVWLNGQYLGSRAGSVYRYDVAEHIKLGENSLKIIVTGNAMFNCGDWLSGWVFVKPTGFDGKIRLF